MSETVYQNLLGLWSSSDNLDMLYFFVHNLKLHFLKMDLRYKEAVTPSKIEIDEHEIRFYQHKFDVYGRWPQDPDRYAYPIKKIRTRRGTKEYAQAIQRIEKSTHAAHVEAEVNCGAGRPS